MDALSTGPDAEEAAAEERLSRSISQNEFDVAIDTLLLYKTPEQILSLMERGLPGDFPIWRLSTFWLRRKKALVLKRLEQDLAGITVARKWQRQTLSPNAFLYSDPAAPAGGKTLLVGFGGNALRLMMPTYCVLKSLDPSAFDLLLLRDPTRRHYEAGVEGLGSDIGAIAKTVDDMAKQAGYRKVMALGTSGGGLAAICASILNSWERVVTFGCDNPTSHPEIMKYFGAFAQRADNKPDVRLFYSALVERDNDAAQSVANLFPAAVKVADHDIKTHNLIYRLYTQGRLPGFFQEHFG